MTTEDKQELTKEIVTRIMHHPIAVNNGKAETIELESLLRTLYKRTHDLETSIAHGEFKVMIPSEYGEDVPITLAKYLKFIKNDKKITWKEIGFLIKQFLLIASALFAAISILRLLGVLQ